MTIPPKYPAGEYVGDANPSADTRADAISRIASLPARLRSLVEPLSAERLDAKYVNWTVRQIINHIADSHVNGFIRHKLALTEDRPTIKPYDETAWAKLPDATCDPQVSLRLLDALHERWAGLLRSLSEADFARPYFHPEHGRDLTLGESLLQYAWHGDHHAAQIAWLRPGERGA